MTTNAKTADKSTVLDSLAYDTKTAKRVAYSQWEFTIVGPYEIEVCNASYGYLKDEHTYRVMIDEEGIPVSCTCKGFKHYHRPNGRVGKHMLAIATIGGPIVLEAAVNVSTPSGNPERPNASRLSDKLRADGGATTEGVSKKSKSLDGAEPDECDCAELSDDFPCWPCVRDGKRELPNR